MFVEEKVLVFRCTCDLCSHQWKAWSLPLRCSKCKRPEWNRVQANRGLNKGNIEQVEQPLLPERELISLEDILSWKR